MSLPQNKSQNDQPPINTKLIEGCILEGRVHEIPKRLNLWKLRDCEKGLSEDEKISLKAATCLYWYKRIWKECHLCIYKLAKKGIECLIACFKSPPEWVNDPLEFYLWRAIRNIVGLVILGFGGTELLPSPQSAKLQQNGQALLELLEKDLSYAMMSIYANRFTVEHACLLMVLLFKKQSNLPNSGWLLEFNFNVSECLSETFSFCLFQILSPLLCDTDIACQLLQHGMQVQPEDVASAFIHLTDDCDYKVFHQLVNSVPTCRSKNLDLILENQAFAGIVQKLNFTAIILSHSLSRHGDTIYCSHKINKFIKICSCEAVHPQNLKQLSASCLTSNIRSMLLVSLWSSKEIEKCQLLLETGGLNESIILDAFENYSTSILDSQLEPLYKLLSAHSSLNFCKLFKTIFNHKPTIKHKMVELYKFSLLHVTNENTVDFLHLAYTQGKYDKPRNVIINGAVQLCLKTGDTRLLTKACDEVARYQPLPKVTDSSGLSPYHIVANLWPERKDDSVHVKVCEILSKYKFIDPTLKDHKSKTALDYATKRKLDCCINAIMKAKNNWTVAYGTNLECLNSNAIIPIKELNDPSKLSPQQSSSKLKELDEKCTVPEKPHDSQVLENTNRSPNLYRCDSSIESVKKIQETQILNSQDKASLEVTSEDNEATVKSGTSDEMTKTNKTTKLADENTTCTSDESTTPDEAATLTCTRTCTTDNSKDDEITKSANESDTTDGTTTDETSTCKSKETTLSNIILNSDKNSTISDEITKSGDEIVISSEITTTSTETTFSTISDENPTSEMTLSTTSDQTLSSAEEITTISNDTHDDTHVILDETSKDIHATATTAELLEQLHKQPLEYFTATEVSNDDTAEGDDDDNDISGHDIKYNEDDEQYYLDTKKSPVIQKPDPSPEVERVLDDPEQDDFHSLPWEIFICKQAADFLKGRKTSPKVICDIINKLRRIGRGERSNVICHRLIKNEDRLYETVLYNGARIIWCEDIQYSELKSSPEKQEIIYCDVVRVIWITLKHSVHQLNDVLQKVKHALLKSRNSRANSKKNLRMIPSECKDEVRYRFPRMFRPDTVNFQQESDTLVPKLHPLPNLHGGEFSVMQFHPFFSFLNTLLNADPSQRECAIGMSEEEHEIISLPYGKEAIILCGRSGTGKTTTCIYRMWNEFHTFIANMIPSYLQHGLPDQHEINKNSEVNQQDDLQLGVFDQQSKVSKQNEVSNQQDEYDQCVFDQQGKVNHQGEPQSLHQIFITKSPILCSQVKKEFDKLVKSCGDLNKLKFNRTVLHNMNTKLSDYGDEMFPLFLTSRKFLLHLDSTLEGDKFFPRDEKGELSIQLDTYDYSEEVMSNPDCLFENLYEDAEHKTTDDQEESKSQKPCAIEINADFFCYKIWPTMSDSVKGNLHDPLLVWTEIQSFIKGSKTALESENGYLTEDQYRDLGKYTAPNFNKEGGSSRDQCYSIFQSYRKIVKERKLKVFLFDENDLIFNIYKRLQQYVVRGRGNHIDWYIDHFYIDEVQDFTQAELCLLLSCCRNPNGTFCTGDVAQNIMKGVFFRFEDLRSQFHSLLVEVPKLHSLKENFRSHSGVLNLAQSVLHILTHKFRKSFPDSHLPEEIAMFEGPKPILVQTSSKDELARILLGNEDESDIPHELGAHQAIIVRSDEARKNLPSSLKGGLVFTVLEAKGLEFNDVLLYNFFSDSQVKDQWRFLYNVCKLEESQEAKEKLQIKILHPLRRDEKQEEKLKSLSAELKHLYTAITRARMNLWIYDEGIHGCHKPFYYYCIVKKLARLVIASAEENVAGDDKLMFAAPSPDEQWSKQGDYFFDMRRWKLAIICYSKGKNYQKKYATQAYLIVEDATQSESQEKQNKFYEEAARLFLCADKCKHSNEYIEKAIQCLHLAKIHAHDEIAAFLLEKIGNDKKALRLWTLIGNMKKMVEMYEKLKNYSEAIRCLTNNGNDYGAALLKAEKYEETGIELDEDVKPQQIAYAYIQRKEGKNMHVDMAEALKYVSDGSVRATLLREAGRLEEAADEFLKVGHYDQANRIFEAQGLFEKRHTCTIVEDDRQTQAKFLLYHTTSFLKNSNGKMTVEIEQNLKQLGKSMDEYYQGHSQMILGISEHSNLLLFKAIEKFQHFGCLPGEVHAFCSLKSLKVQTLPGDDLHNSEAAYNIAEAIEAERKSTNESSFKMQSNKIYQEVLRLHNLHHKASENRYFISPFLLECNIYPKLKMMYEKANSSSTVQQIDEDGMLALDKLIVDEVLINYYLQMSCDILKDASHFTELPKKIKSSQVHNFLKLPSNRLGKPLSSISNLDSYFKNLKELIQYLYLTKKKLDHEALLKIFSPDVAIYLNITERNIRFLKRNSKCVTKIMTELAMNVLEDSESTLQTYITTFRILTAFVGKYNAKHKIMEVMKSSSACKYVFTNEKSGKQMHVFNGWFITHENIQKGEIIKAAESAYYYFLKRIANLEEGVRNEALSISTINYIVSILSTALLIVLQSVDLRMLYIFPRYYEMLFNNFNIFCSNSILPACLFQCHNGGSFKGIALKYLSRFLSYLLGEDGSRYNVLYIALTTKSCIQDGSGFFCLMNSLILASNLYCAAFYLYDQTNMKKIHSQLVSIHKIVRASKRAMIDSGAEFLSCAIECLSSAENINEIFTFVCEQLQQYHQKPDLMKAVHKITRIDLELVYRSEYPVIRIKKLVTIMDPSGELCLQEPEKSNLTSPTEKEIEFNDEEDAERADKNFVHSISAEDPNESSDLVSSDYCNVCGVALIQGESGTGDDSTLADYNTHLNSTDHTDNVEAYKDYIAEKEKIEKEVSNLSNEVEALHSANTSVKLRKMITNLEAMNTQQQKVHNDTMKQCNWINGTLELLMCVEKLQEYKEQYLKLKCYYENRKKPAQIPDEEEEILPEDTGPPKLSKKKSKKTKKSRSKPKH